MLDRVNYRWQGHGGGEAPHPGWWYMLHGGTPLTVNACQLSWWLHASKQGLQCLDTLVSWILEVEQAATCISMSASVLCHVNIDGGQA